MFSLFFFPRVAQYGSDYAPTEMQKELYLPCSDCFLETLPQVWINRIASTEQWFSVATIRRGLFCSIHRLLGQIPTHFNNRENGCKGEGIPEWLTQSWRWRGDRYWGQIYVTCSSTSIQSLKVGCCACCSIAMEMPPLQVMDDEDNLAKMGFFFPLGWWGRKTFFSLLTKLYLFV